MLVLRLSKHGWCVLGIVVFVVILYYSSSSNFIGHLDGEVISIHNLLARSIRLAEKSGALIKKVHQEKQLNIHQKVSKNDQQVEPVTEADLQSHNLIVNDLNEMFPNLLLRSEEHTTNSNNNKIKKDTNGKPKEKVFISELPEKDLFVPIHDVSVWIDPLDATQEFTENLLEYVSVMICIVLHDRPIAGIIHQPFLNKTYWAWNFFALSTSLHDLIKKPRANVDDHSINIIYSRSHLNQSIMPDLNQKLSSYELKTTSAGGSGFKVLEIIRGNADVYVHPSGTRRWDVCAPQAILEAAGGHLTGFDGSEISYPRDASPSIPKSVGIFAASDKPTYTTWIDKLYKIYYPL